MGSQDFGGNSEFQSTQWSEVFRARADQSTVRRQALGELARSYSGPLYAHLVRGKRCDTHRAADLLQGFLTDKLLERRLVEHADPARGKFRSLLVRALDNYMIDTIRKERPNPITGAVELESDPAIGEDRQAFDLAWAQQLLTETLKRMEAQCRRKQQTFIWDVFQCRLLIPTRAGSKPSSYEELVHRFGFKSPEQASNALVTAKRTFNRVFAEVAEDYLGPGETPEDLLRDLLATLHRAGPLDWRSSAEAADSANAMESSLGEVLGDSSPRLVAELLEREPTADAMWESHDLGALLRHQLDQPCTALLNVESADLNAGDLAPSDGFTLGDLFEHSAPSLTALEAAKRYGRKQARAAEGTVPRDVGTVIYFSSIAAALVRRDCRITTSGDDVLRFGLERVCEHPWIPDELRGLLMDAWQNCQRNCQA